MKYLSTTGSKLRLTTLGCFVVVFCSNHLYSQFTQNVVSALQLSTGLSKNIKIASGSYGNPALLAFSDAEWVLSANVENRYFTNLLGSSASAIKKIDDYSYVGLLVGGFGFDEYRESEFRASYARKISKSISIGSTLKYNRLAIQEFGSTSVFNINLGLSIKASDRLNWSGLIENILPDQSTISMPFVFSTGVRYQLSSSVQVYGEYEYVKNSNHALRGGIIYSLSNDISVYLGILTSPSSPSIGMDMSLTDNLSITISTLHHQALGVRGGLGLNWTIE